MVPMMRCISNIRILCLFETARVQLVVQYCNIRTVCKIELAVSSCDHGMRANDRVVFRGDIVIETCDRVPA
jgi:hypothetical protein